MKYCSICGIEFSDSAYRCPSCGAEPANAAQEEAAQTEYVQAEEVNIEVARPEAARPDAARAEAVHAERVPPGGASTSGGAPARGDVSPKIEDHLVKSIISTICCCQPFGIVAIVYAAKVGPLLRQNNFEAALDASQKANLWGNLAIGLGVLFQALWAIFFVPFIGELMSRMY